MQTRRRTWRTDLHIALASVLMLGAATFIPVDSAQARFKVLYAFGGAGDGGIPTGPLIRKAQYLYGLAERGGDMYCYLGCGIAFKLASDGTETVLHTFANSDGVFPNAGLIMDKAGNLYGTTKTGGFDLSGTIFRLASDGTFTVLHYFTGSDGANPRAGVIADKAGRLYGTTKSGGAFGYGTVFELAPDGTLTTLYSFTGGSDGLSPHGLIMDQARDLYGTTEWGGAFGYGTVFELAPDGTLTTLHAFTGGSDGMDPQSKLLMDEKYNLYGTTLFGGAYSAGTVFKVALDGTLTTLYSFTGGGDGAYPSSGVIADETGSLYGTTVNGGAHDQGAVYKLAPDGSETVLHSFYKNHNGGFPDSNLTMDRKGKLYGATQEGGANGHGTVFSLSSRNAATEDEK